MYDCKPTKKLKHRESREWSGPLPTNGRSRSATPSQSLAGRRRPRTSNRLSLCRRRCLLAPLVRAALGGRGASLYVGHVEGDLCAIECARTHRGLRAGRGCGVATRGVALDAVASALVGGASATAARWRELWSGRRSARQSDSEACCDAAGRYWCEKVCVSFALWSVHLMCPGDKPVQSSDGCN